VLNRWKDRNPDGTEADTEPETEAAESASAEADGAEGADGGRPGDAGAESAAADGDRSGSLDAELAELKDRHLRLAAEFENFRKRTRKEAAVGRTLAQAELVQQILPTLDDLARVADTPHETTTVQALDEGIELILRNLRKQLGDAGLERIEALDQPFNPERHQAIMTTTVDDPDLDETVSRVFQEGYEFLGRLVRPAQVEVRRYEEPADEDEAD
jgi:molecular chaperone GrpE